jgi:hypothetical protein
MSADKHYLFCLRHHITHTTKYYYYAPTAGNDKKENLQCQPAGNYYTRVRYYLMAL